jgi:hypothetical protein
MMSSLQTDGADDERVTARKEIRVVKRQLVAPLGPVLGGERGAE